MHFTTFSERMKRFVMLLPLLATALTSMAQSSHCLADRYAQVALFDSAQIVLQTDVHFATSVRWPGTQVDSLRMDIYMPDPSLDPVAERPLIVLVHGGAFMAGNRNEMAYMAMEMARRGFVTATISYRLGWGCQATDLLGACTFCQGLSGNLRIAMYRAVQDARAALRHLVHHAESLGIDADQIFTMGTSAGAITAMHAAFWDQAEASAWCPQCEAQVGLLDTTGNALTATYTIKGVVNNCGAVGLTEQLADPVPVIGFHDNQDIVVPYGYGQFLNCMFGGFGSNSIYTSLTANGQCAQMNTVVNGFGEILHCSYPANAVIAKASCFLKGVLCDNCTSGATTQIWDGPDCLAGAVEVGIAPTRPPAALRIKDGLLTAHGLPVGTIITAMDMTGRTVWQQPSTATRLPLPPLGAGSYVLWAFDSNGERIAVRWTCF